MLFRRTNLYFSLFTYFLMPMRYLALHSLWLRHEILRVYSMIKELLFLDLLLQQCLARQVLYTPHMWGVHIIPSRRAPSLLSNLPFRKWWTTQRVLQYLWPCLRDQMPTSQHVTHSLNAFIFMKLLKDNLSSYNANCRPKHPEVLLPVLDSAPLQVRTF